MNRILLPFFIFLFAISGWLTAALLWLRAPQATEEKQRTSIHESSERSEPRPVQPPRQGLPVAHETTTMEVYVRPHPPDFVTGRKIRFQSYTVFHDGEIEKIRFMDGDTVTVVDSEAVDWPQQTRVPAYR